MILQDISRFGPAAAETEALYFRLYHSYLLQTPDLKTNYDMLLDLWRSHPESFHILSKCDLERLRRVQLDIQNNQYTLFTGPLDLGPDVPDVLRREKTSTKHQEICKEITRTPEVLEPYTGPIEFMNREHPTYFGPIDILVLSRGCAYIIEVKTNAADHAICGQVQKYFVGLSLKLYLKAFDDIKIITLCPGYDRASHQGLRRLGAHLLMLRDSPLEIKELQLL